MSADDVWTLLDAQLADGHFPGYVAVISSADGVAARANGRLAFDSDASMQLDTQFRIASLSKLVGGVLTLGLVRHGVLSLDDPITRWLPEFAEQRVLRAPEAELSDTEPLDRPLVVRDLLTFIAGFGLLLADSPLNRAIADRGLLPGAVPPGKTGDEFVTGWGGLPLAQQPGAGWNYHGPSDVLGVLLARAAGQELDQLVADRICRPLGLTRTGFRALDPARFPTLYRPSADGLVVLDPPDSRFAVDPPFLGLGGGMISTVEDYLAFLEVFSGRTPVLTADEARSMTTPTLTDQQRRAAEPITGAGVSWGLLCSVDVEAVESWQNPGRFGWHGGSGTTAFVDPGRGITAVLFTQRALSAPLGEFDRFWTAVYA